MKEGRKRSSGSTSKVTGMGRGRKGERKGRGGRRKRGEEPALPIKNRGKVREFVWSGEI